MPYPRRELVGMWLQKWTILHPLLLRLDKDGILPDGRRRYVNRVSGHLVMKGVRDV